MGFQINDSFVRGELFTENLKWKYTVCIDMREYWGTTKGRPWEIHDCVREAFYKTPSEIRGVVDGEFKDWFLFVPDPCHQYQYPIAIKLGYKEIKGSRLNA